MGTSMWFAGNAVSPDVVREAALPESALAHITSAVQVGFIAGTFLFSLLSIADRFKPSSVFLCCALLGALFNGGIALRTELGFILLSRFLTGFFLAGIYPVGMKIASDYFEKGLGQSLGWLVGALVLGTAFPHLLRSLSTELPWRKIILTVSVLASVGGLIMFLFVPNGPFRKTPSTFRLSSFLDGFRDKTFRVAAFGYFGHMWELYAFWAFVPVIWKRYSLQAEKYFDTALLSFWVIAAGAVGCVAAGILSERMPAKKIARVALMLSGLCCLSLPMMLNAPFYLILLFMIFWGIMVVADSPMFSSLVAQHAPPQTRGTALTIVTCIGFAITIISIQVLGALNAAFHNSLIFLILALGPIVGVIGLFRKT